MKKLHEIIPRKYKDMYVDVARKHFGDDNIGYIYGTVFCEWLNLDVEEESTKPVVVKESGKRDFHDCGVCGKPVMEGLDAYCPYCGMKIKWGEN